MSIVSRFNLWYFTTVKSWLMVDLSWWWCACGWCRLWVHVWELSRRQHGLGAWLQAGRWDGADHGRQHGVCAIQVVPRALCPGIPRHQVSISLHPSLLLTAHVNCHHLLALIIIYHHPFHVSTIIIYYLYLFIIIISFIISLINAGIVMNNFFKHYNGLE